MNLSPQVLIVQLTEQEKTHSDSIHAACQEVSDQLTGIVKNTPHGQVSYLVSGQVHHKVIRLSWVPLGTFL